MQKAASSGVILGGAALAEALGVTTPMGLALEGVWDSEISNQIKLAYALASLEDQLERPDTPQWFSMARAVDPKIQPPMDITPMGKVGSSKLATGLTALASQKIAMTLGDFVRLHLGDGAKSAAFTDQASGLLPGIYNRLVAGGNLESEIVGNPFKPSRDLAPESQRQWAEKQASTHSLSREHASLRCQLSAIRNMSSPVVMHQPTTKRAAASSSEIETLARRYALYKLAFLSTQGADLPLTSQLLICQNYQS